MAHYEPPHQDLRCLKTQLFSSLVLKELMVVIDITSAGVLYCMAFKPFQTENLRRLIRIAYKNSNLKCKKVKTFIRNLKTRNGFIQIIRTDKSNVSQDMFSVGLSMSMPARFCRL